MIAAIVAVIAAIMSPVGIYVAVSASSRPDLSFWSANYIEPMFWAVVGGLLAELMAWYDWEAKNPSLKKLYSLRTIFIKISIVSAGALITLAYLRSGQKISPLFAIQLGATTPIVLRQLLVSSDSPSSIIKAEEGEKSKPGVDATPALRMTAPDPSSGRIGVLSNPFFIDGSAARLIRLPIEYSLKSTVVGDIFTPNKVKITKKAVPEKFQVTPATPGPRTITAVADKQKYPELKVQYFVIDKTDSEADPAPPLVSTRVESPSEA